MGIAYLMLAYFVLTNTICHLSVRPCCAVSLYRLRFRTEDGSSANESLTFRSLLLYISSAEKSPRSKERKKCN